MPPARIDFALDEKQNIKLLWPNMVLIEKRGKKGQVERVKFVVGSVPPAIPLCCPISHSQYGPPNITINEDGEFVKRNTEQ